MILNKNCYNKYKYGLILIAFVFLCGCQSAPKNPEMWMAFEKNACLPTAIAFKNGLERSGVWSKVVTYYWYDEKTNKNKGHAVTAYLYPPGKNQLWTYDYLGSYRTRAFVDNPMDIAEAAVRARGQFLFLTEANFLE